MSTSTGYWKEVQKDQFDMAGVRNGKSMKNVHS